MENLFEILGNMTTPNKPKTAELKEFAKQKAKEIGRALLNDDDIPRSSVGAQQDTRFQFDGREFKMKVDAFWEKSNHVDYSVICFGYINDFHEVGVPF